MFDVMFHRQRDIIFSVKHAGYESDRATRDQFTNENHAAPPRVGGFLPNIETQVHFLKIAMKRNRQTKQSRVEKEKTDHDQKRFAVLEIDLSSRRNQWCDDRWVDNEIEHGGISPIRRQKRS